MGPNKCCNNLANILCKRYKYHTAKHAQGKKTNNSGVSVRGDAGTGESTWHGVLRQILELEYVGDDPQIQRRVVLFNCEWYDPTHPEGTRKHTEYNILEVNHKRRFGAYDPFILAQDARQVYYTRYPGKCRSKWMFVFPTKPRGRVEVEDLPDDAYQIETNLPTQLVSDTGAPDSLRVETNELDIIDHTQVIQHSNELVDSDQFDDDDDDPLNNNSEENDEEFYSSES